jgi:hypothetical protein
MTAGGEAMPEPKPKHRRSIFDTLKKSADGRLGLAEAAHLADKISVFPVRQVQPAPYNDPTIDPTYDPSPDPMESSSLSTLPASAASSSPSDHQSGQTTGHPSDHIPIQESDHLSGQLSGPWSGQETRQVSGPLSGHEPTIEPTNVPTRNDAALAEPTVVPTNDPTSAPTVRRDDDPDIRRIIRSLSGNKRRFLHFVIDNEPVNDDYILSRQAVARTLHLTEISVKRYFAEFAALGFFHKETYRRGVCQGLRLFLSRARCQAFKRLDPTVDPTDDLASELTEVVIRCKKGEGDPTNDPSPDPTSYKEDRKKETLSISSERMAVTWPRLHRAGFGREQFGQILVALAELGKTVDKVVQGLDHAEWELAQGAMRDKDGQPVDDPCAWVFASLARTGYYRRPKGYVSPEEQAQRDAEEEARAVAVARQKAEQARFETWRDGLSPEELAKAMRGHIGGPRDAWLKVVWRKSGGGVGA